jgi:hypothetical protein
MKATDFEYRHQTLLHLLLVGLAVSTYFVTRDDIVWAAVRRHGNSAFLEQLVFGVGTLLLLGCAMVETWAEAHGRLRSPLLLSRLLFALVVGLLLPLPGTIVLLGGEGLLVFRLFQRHRDSPRVSAQRTGPQWGQAFRRAISKWGLTASMIVFTVTLRDGIAEIGAAVSVLLWLALNFRRLVESYDS